MTSQGISATINPDLKIWSTEMPGLAVKDPAERFDLSYLFADGNRKKIEDLANTAKEIKARCAMVHVTDLRTLVPLLQGSCVRPEAVIDFPDGLGGWRARESEVKQAVEDGAVGGDLVINLRYVAERRKNVILQECRKIRQYLPQIKLICQIPYLWQKDHEAICWLLGLLLEADVYCVKDWTARHNFSGEVDTSTAARIRYTEFMAELITKNNLLLFIKIAGGVDASNAKFFVDAGADFLGLSYGKAKTVREALL